jgi:hypothetical protein
VEASDDANAALAVLSRKHPRGKGAQIQHDTDVAEAQEAVTVAHAELETAQEHHGRDERQLREKSQTELQSRLIELMASKESRYSTKKSISEAIFGSGNCGLRACWFNKEIAPRKVTWAICAESEATIWSWYYEHQAAALTECALGQRINVRWDETGKWYWTKCIGFDQECNKHTIEYGDGSTEHLVLADATWEQKLEDQVMEEMVVEEVEEVEVELEEQLMEEDNAGCYEEQEQQMAVDNGNEADDQEQDQERAEGVSTGRYAGVVATIVGCVVHHRPWGT